jgi:hypothetical protein
MCPRRRARPTANNQAAGHFSPVKEDVLKDPRRYAPVFIVVLVLVLLAVGLSACGSSVKKYSDSTYGYSFSYPNAWKVQAGSSDVTAGGTSAANVGVYNPDGTQVNSTYVDLAMIMVYKLTLTVTDPWSSDIQKELEGVLTSLQGQATDVKVEVPLKQTTTAGLKGYVVTYTFTKDGATLRSTLYFLFNGDKEYELTQQAATATWDATKPALDSIVASFKP